MTVVVATFGDPEWPALAEQRAIPSAQAEGVPVIHVHSDTLHTARNQGLDQVQTEWVCHLDADDELEPGYFDAMATAAADMRAPAVRYVTDNKKPRPMVLSVAGHRHNCTADCLVDGNWMVIGTLARAELLHQVGGWRDFPWSEDWDLWLRCHLAGANAEAVQAAVYRAHVRPDSRNRGISVDERLAVHKAIAAANGIAA